MTPKEAYALCYEGKKIPELEDIIATDPHYSYRYALEIIKGRWRQCEEIITTSPHYSYNYARDIIRGRWKKCENIISKDPHYSYWYARDAIRGPFEKCHHIIFNSERKDDYMDFLKSINYDMNKISEWLL
jgi:hypothetical protein